MFAAHRSGSLPLSAPDLLIYFIVHLHENNAAEVGALCHFELSCFVAFQEVLGGHTKRVHNKIFTFDSKINLLVVSGFSFRELQKEINEIPFGQTECYTRRL